LKCKKEVLACYSFLSLTYPFTALNLKTMARDNRFYICEMASTIVSTYYLNSAYPTFDHFTFQPIIENGDAANDEYLLVVYAVGAAGTILGPPGGYNLSKPKTGPNPGLKANAQVQFANMRLDKTGLGTLYPGGVVTPSALVLTPAAYGTTNYVSYEVYNPDSPALASVTINPSPPAP
jgi:hypothetical protein